MTDAAVAIGSSAALLGIALLFRIGPQLGRPPVGCDAWFYLSYARELRRTRRFPVRLPGYLLDIPEQWYPPVFPALLSIVSPKVLDRWHWLIAPALDLAQMAMLLAFVWTRTGSVQALLLSGLVYVVSPTLVHDTQTMTSRPLGNLLSTVVLLCAIELGGPVGITVGAVTFALVLLSHKLSTQLLVVLLPVLAVVMQRVEYMAITLGGVLLALVLSRGFYWKILLGHIDVLRFWRQNYELYTAHQFDDSPVYGGGGPTKHRYYTGGVRGWLHLVGRLVLHAPFTVMLIPSWPLVTSGDPIAWWALCVAVAAFVTTVIPALRFVGEGHKYWKYGTVPLAYLSARLVMDGDVLAVALFATALVASFVSLAYIYRTPAGDRSLQSRAQDEMARYILSSDIDRIVCLPLTIADKIAYETGRSVFWGTHSAGHQMVAGFYPIVTRPFSELAQQWRPGGLVVDPAYIDPRRLGVPLGSPIFQAGPYRLYRWPGASSTPSIH